MRRLTHRDVRALLAFLPELYAVRDLDAFARHVVGAMPKLIPCDISTYNEMNPRQRRIRWMSDPVEAEGAADRNAFERHMGEHPILAHYARTGDGKAVTVADFVTQRQFHRLALYNEFYRPIDIEDMIAVHLGYGRSLAIAVSLLRSSRTFTGDHHVLLNLLRPHLVQAYSNAEAVTQLRQELRATGRALEAADHGIVLLTPAGRARLMTAKARRWIAEYFGSSGDRLPDDLRRWVRHREDRTRESHAMGASLS